jgi:hypothetical protein
VIREEFTKQAPNGGKNDIPPHLQWIGDHLDLDPTWEVLDVAAGTGLLSGRSLRGSNALSPWTKPPKCGHRDARKRPGTG